MIPRSTKFTSLNGQDATLSYNERLLFLISDRESKVGMVLALRGVLVSSVLFLSLTVMMPLRATAHVEQPHPLGGGQGAKGEVGLDERLGARIPLDLVFRDETGKQHRLREYITGPTVILPVYYSCTNVCNYLQEGLARVLPDIKLVPGKEYRVLSVSFDDNETPAQAMRSRNMYYTAMQERLPGDAWHFLTGDARNIKAITGAAGFSFRRRGNDFIHPVVSIVVTGDGMIVRYLYGTHFLAKDVTLALMEARQGRIGNTIRHVVGYCFTFDPKSKSYVFNLLRVSATVIILCAGGFLTYLLLTGKKKRPAVPPPPEQGQP